MDFNSLKILYLINQFTDEVDIDIICSKSRIPKDDFIEIIFCLEENAYIKFVRNGYVESTNKGKTYFSHLLVEWLSHNILAIIAIIISIIALFN